MNNKEKILLNYTSLPIEQIQLTFMDKNGFEVDVESRVIMDIFRSVFPRLDMERSQLGWDVFIRTFICSFNMLYLDYYFRYHHNKFMDLFSGITFLNAPRYLFEHLKEMCLYEAYNENQLESKTISRSTNKDLNKNILGFKTVKVSDTLDEELIGDSSQTEHQYEQININQSGLLNIQNYVLSDWMIDFLTKYSIIFYPKEEERYRSYTWDELRSRS